MDSYQIGVTPIFFYTFIYVTYLLLYIYYYTSYCIFMGLLYLWALTSIIILFNNIFGKLRISINFYFIIT